MARLLIAILATTSCAALNAPRARALKITGGGLDIQKVGTALIGLEGLVGMIAPEAACKQYRYTPSADDTAFKRYTSAWLGALARLLSSDAKNAASTCLFLAAAVMTVAGMPWIEQLGLNKLTVGAWIPLCLVLSKLSYTGDISRPLSPPRSRCRWALPDCLETEWHYKLYGSEKMSPFSRMFTQLIGSVLVSAGTYTKRVMMRLALGHADCRVVLPRVENGRVAPRRERGERGGIRGRG